jgi:hypothetical protein
MNILEYIDKVKEPKRAPLFLAQNVLNGIFNVCKKSMDEDVYRMDAKKRLKCPTELIDPLP